MAYENLRRARVRATWWVILGLAVAGFGIGTLVDAMHEGGVIWTGAIFVGLLMVFRGLRARFRAGELQRALLRQVRG